MGKSLIGKLKALENYLQDKDFKIHKLLSETEELIVISQKGEKNSYSFYIPDFKDLDTSTPQVTLVPIPNIFDYLEEKNVIMEPMNDQEEPEYYGRGR